MRSGIIIPAKQGLEKNLGVLKKISKIWWGPCSYLTPFYHITAKLCRVLSALSSVVGRPFSVGVSFCFFMLAFIFNHFLCASCVHIF